MKRSRLGLATAFTIALAGSSVLGQDVNPSNIPAATPRPSEPQPSSNDPKKLIDEMTIAGMAEVELGKLAEARGSKDEVKAFGQMMVKDHSAADAELKRIASQLNLQQPTQIDEKHRELVSRLSKLQGAEFDTAYIEAMVHGHEEVVARLRAIGGSQLTANPSAGDRAAGSTAAAGAASAQPTDRTAPAAGSGAVGTSGTAADAQRTMTEWAAKTLPTVQQHLAKAREIAEKVGK